MDTAIPLGIIVSELISNSLKHAFQPGKKGEISISLYRIEDNDRVRENSDYRTQENPAVPETNRDYENERHLQYMLVVADNGPASPKNSILKMQILSGSSSYMSL